MNCQRFETLLTDCMDKALDRPVQEAMRQHLGSCTECERLFSDVGSLKEELADLSSLPVSETLLTQILQKTCGEPRRASIWHDIVLPTLSPFVSQRYAFATVMMFVFISLMANVLGPEFSAFSRNPSLLLEKADQVSTQVYGSWRKFNDFKTRVGQEIVLFASDLFGRLDYHLIALLFQEYEVGSKEGSKTLKENGVEEGKSNE